MIIEVERVTAIPDTKAKRRECWRVRFAITYDRITVTVLDYRQYCKPSPTRRSAMITIPGTNYNHRDNRSDRDGNGLLRDRVPLPLEVRQDAVRRFTDRITWQMINRMKEAAE